MQVYNPEGSMDVFFLLSGDINSLTGGHLYNRHMVEGLKQKGHRVKVLRLDESTILTHAIELKSSSYFNTLPPGSCVLIDSLVLGNIPGALKKYSEKLTFIGLIHLPLTYNPLPGKNRKHIATREVKAMMFTRHLVVTGRFTLRMLMEAGISHEKISLIEPGVENYPRKRYYADLPSVLLCISNYSQIKDQLLLVRAINKLRYNKWTLHMYGNTNTEKPYVTRLKSIIANKKMNDRILLHDSIDRNNISEAFLASDLFVLPSRFETYGMVLTEALAHGLPVVTTNSGNIPDTVPQTMGVFTEPGNLDSLVSAITLLFTNSQHYQSLCMAASGYYRQAKTWQNSLDMLERLITDIRDKNGK